MATGAFLNTNPRLLSPLSIRMLGKKAAVRIHRVRAPCALPVAILAKLNDPCTRLRHELASGRACGAEDEKLHAEIVGKLRS